MVTVTSLKVPLLTLLGNKLIESVNVSLFSNIKSLTTLTSNGTLITPARNVMLYGPGL